MKFLYKYGTRPNEIRRARKELYLRLSLVLAVLLFFLGMFLITKFRPRLDEADARNLPEVGNMGDPMKNPELNKLRAEVAQLRQEFHEAAAGGTIGADGLELLEAAKNTQQEIIRMRGSEIANKADLDQLNELQTLYDEEMGKFLIAQSKRLEDEAESHYAEQNYEEALQRLSRSRNLQEEINNQYPKSSFRSSTRLHQLNNTLQTWRTKPIAEEADALKKQALRLVEEMRYAEAREVMQQALNTQQTLNESHRGSRFATISRLRQFEEAWKSVQIAENEDTIAILMADSATALKTEQNDLAISKAEAAEALQEGIIAQFPELKRTSENTLAEIQTLKDTASSLPAFREIEQMGNTVRKLLQTRQMDPFKNTVSDWLRATRNFVRNYPNSDFIDQVDDREVNFLHEKRDEIPTLLETVYGNLKAVPDHKNLYLYQTEVPQILYSRVMNENPSSFKDAQYPVESVTWIEAKEFARKLSWVLAYPVELPSREVILRVLKEVDEPDLGAFAWSSQNANRETRPVGTSRPNTLGFYDLLGNVAEWLKAEADDRPEQAAAIGGSARDSFNRLATIPEESRAPTERNRFVGFRFAVRIPNK